VYSFNACKFSGMFMLATATVLVASFVANAQMMGSGSMSDSQMRSHQALMAWANGASLEARPGGPKPKFDGNLRLLGGAWYGQLCTPCHGVHGDGTGPRANQLSPRPRDFTKGVYEFRSTPSGALPTDEDLWKVVSQGIHGTAMVPWITSTDDDRWALVAYIESFSPRFAAEARPSSINVPTPPVETPQLLAQGQKAFGDAGCVECHGARGLGDGPSVPTLKDASGRPIRPIDFPSEVFRRSPSMKDIFLTVRTGLDGTPMPSYADSLTLDQTWAIAAYVRSLVGKHGANESSPRSTIAIEARQQEHLGMMIDMPGMGRMPMSRMSR
jgi:mono/diheme cytochrome c family protein